MFHILRDIECRLSHHLLNFLYPTFGVVGFSFQLCYIVESTNEETFHHTKDMVCPWTSEIKWVYLQIEFEKRAYGIEVWREMGTVRSVLILLS